MKKMVFVFIFGLFSTTLCSAELYVLVDQNTREVLSASERNDTIPGEGQEIVARQGYLTDFEEENPTNYKLNGNRFVRNIAKIDEIEQERARSEILQAEEELIANKIRQGAIEALQAEGVIFQYADKEQYGH